MAECTVEVRVMDLPELQASLAELQEQARDARRAAWQWGVLGFLAGVGAAFWVTVFLIKLMLPLP